MAKTIDWAKLGWCMTQNVQVGSTACSMYANGGARFAAFKSQSDAAMTAFAGAKKRPTNIDFDHYKAALPDHKKWVADMEAKYNATKIPQPKDVLSDSINADDSKVASAIDNAQKALDQAATDAVAETSMLKGLPPVDQMTHADIYRAFPELNPFVPEEMETYYWCPTFTRDVDLLKSEMRGDDVDGARIIEDIATYKPKALAENTDVDLDLWGKPKEA